MEYQENLDKARNFRVFEIFVKTNEVFRSFSLEELQNFVPEDILVPFVRIDTLKNLMNTPLTVESALGGEKDGLVYKPINSQIFELDKETGAIKNYVAVKHKTERFTEIKNNAKEKKQIELSTEQAKFNSEIDRYFTMARLESVMSKETFDDRITVFGENTTSKFISQLSNTQIEKLIVALSPIVSAIDKEVALLNEEEKSSKSSRREILIKTIEKNLKSGIKFDKLTLSELVQLTNLTDKAVK